MRYYKALRPDGSSFHDPTFRWVPEAGPIIPGHVVTHPSPHDNDPSGWLSVSTIPTDCTGMQWPCRLLEVAPVDGRPVTAPLRGTLPNKRAASAWRVVGELPAIDTLGPQGVEVAAIIERASRLTPDEVRRLDAAWYAAWYAARGAARYAAWDAAWDAAGDAAWYAARDAAWDAARDAAGAAAWDAAKDAAGYAAGYAARAAARALTVRDLISTERYDILTRPWASVIGLTEKN